jgi:hypothetical protein
MQSPSRLLLLNVILLALFSNWCGGEKDKRDVPSPSSIASPFTSTAPKRLSVTTGREVIFYPTYGYQDANGWNIAVRGWVHDDSRGGDKLLRACKLCKEEDEANCQTRTADLLDHNIPDQQVIIKFDSDPENAPYTLGSNNTDGIVKLDVVLTDEKAKQLLASQGSPNGWLTYRAISGGHTGLGRVKLIAPGGGDSLVSDIDDTIKITEIPAGGLVVLKNTFCHKLQPVIEPEDMAKKYQAFGDIPVHYVSGGPERLYGPLYDSLITGPAGFPEGTFHLRYFPKPATEEGMRTLVDTAKNSMSETYEHKVREINALMDRFPDRNFILAGDSGEVDPEVYNEIKRTRGAHVKEIIIRDLVNDKVVNGFRLDGMTIIKVDPIVCVDPNHFRDLKERVEKAFPKETYRLNTAPPCPPAKSNFLKRLHRN